MWQLIIAMTIWGTLGLFVLKSGLASVDIAFFRCLLGAAVLMPYCWYRGLFSKHLFTFRIVFPVFLGGLFVVLNWVLLFESFKLSSITLGNVSYYMQPVFLILLGRLLFQEDVSLLKWVFIILTICGVLMTMDFSHQEIHAGNNELLGVGCALLAGFFYSLATVIAKKSTHMAPAMMTLLQLMVGALVLLPFIHINLMQLAGVTGVYVITLGLVHTVAAFILYYQSVKKLPTTTIAVISYVDPIVAILTDVVFFDRSLHAIQMLGIAVTLLSSYFVINPQAFKKYLNRFL